MAIKNRPSIPWQGIPLVRFFVPFALGIAMGLDMVPRFSGFLWAFLFLFALLSLRKWPYRWRWLTGILIYTSSFLLGINLSANPEKQEPTQKNEHLTIFGGRVITQKNKPTGSSFTLEIKEAYDTLQQQWIPWKEKTWLFIRLESPITQSYDYLVFQQALKPVAAPKNPYDFDFRAFLQNQKIYRSAFLKEGEWLGIRKPSSWRSRQIDRLRQLMPQPEVSGILAALVFGERSFLSRDIQDQYAQAGAIHVLAVSGLHVGMVLLFLQFIFQFVPWFRGAQGSKYPIPLQIVGIWLYALVTGMSPSVCRASIMLSLLLLAKISRRNTVGANSLAGAGIILLTFRPEWVYSIGFQLSFLAVLGILLLQKPIFRLWKPPNRAWHWLWELSSVSLAAQLATFPLGMYYFHQFPLWFLVSGWLVIPLAPFLIGGTCLLLLVDLIPWFPEQWLAFALQKIILTLNQSMAWMAQHSPGWQRQLYLDERGLLFLFCLLFCGVNWLLLQRKSYLFGATICTWVFLLASIPKPLEHQCEILIPWSKTQATIHVKQGNGVRLWGEIGEEVTSIREYYQQQGVQIKEQQSFPETSFRWQIQETNWLWLKSPLPEETLEQVVDYLIVDAAFVENALLESVLCPDGTLVLVASLPGYHRKKWKEWAATKDYAIWDIAEQGAFQKRF